MAPQPGCVELGGGTRGGIGRESRCGWRKKARARHRLPREQERCADTLRQLQAAGADCVAVVATSPLRNGPNNLNTVTDRFGWLDILVNNVGDFRWARWRKVPLADWCRTFCVEPDERGFRVRRLCYTCARPLGKNCQSRAVGLNGAFGGKISAYALASRGGGAVPLRRWKKRNAR
jgi:hypothetical protein